MSEQKLTLKQAWLATWHFLIGLWNQNSKRFEPNSYGLKAYLNFMPWDYERDVDWRRVYFQITSRIWNEQDVLCPQQLLVIISTLLKKSSEKYGFDLDEVEKILYTLQAENALIDSEFLLWEGSIVKGIAELKLPKMR